MPLLEPILNKATKLALAGCAVVFLLVVGVVVAGVAGLFYMGQGPQGVAVSIEGPTTVGLDEEFALTVVVENQRPSKSFELTDIDIADGYFERFILLGNNPEPQSSMHVPIVGVRSFTFGRDIPAGETVEFEFRLRPVTAGVARGDVDVYEGSRFVTTLLQTEVTED